MKPIRVMIVDDHSVLRSGLRLLLESDPAIIVVAEAANICGALQSVEETKPDIVTLDLTLGNEDGLTLISRLRDACSKARVLVLTMHDDRAFARRAIASGASGYLVKSVVDVELLAAIHGVHQGRSVIHIADDDGVRDSLAEPSNDAEGVAKHSQLDLLTERERQVLLGVAHGYTSSQIGDRLYLSTKTIETYRARLMKKLNLSGRVEIVTFAAANGLLSQDGQNLDELFADTAAAEPNF